MPSLPPPFRPAASRAFLDALPAGAARPGDGSDGETVDVRLPVDGPPFDVDDASTVVLSPAVEAVGPVDESTVALASPLPAGRALPFREGRSAAAVTVPRMPVARPLGEAPGAPRPLPRAYEGGALPKLYDEPVVETKTITHVPNAPALPFGPAREASSHEPPHALAESPSLTLDQHAALSLEIAVDPTRADEALGRFHVTAADKAHLDEVYRARFSADPGLRAQWNTASRNAPALARFSALKAARRFHCRAALEPGAAARRLGASFPNSTSACLDTVACGLGGDRRRSRPMTESKDEARVAAVEEILRAWLLERDVALMCGRWSDGGIMELVLEEGATLSTAHYSGRFAGLRDVGIPGHRHHMHVDLGCVSRVTYAVTPSICYGLKPSFEVRFGGASDDAAFAVTLLAPYRAGQVDVERVARYFGLLRHHASRHASLVRFVADDGGHFDANAAAWRAAFACFARGAEIDPAPTTPEELGRAVRSRYAVHVEAGGEDLPPILRVLDEALGLRGASLVIYRARTLVELKTEQLRQRVSVYEEDGHRSWQIGGFHDHHCHLDLDAVTEVHFDAEPVSCQGGRLNWTVWFLGKGDAGNPYRPSAVCSVTLNRPHGDDGARDRSVVDPVYALYDRVQSLDFVSASAGFTAARHDARSTE